LAVRITPESIVGLYQYSGGEQQPMTIEIRSDGKIVLPINYATFNMGPETRSTGSWMYHAADKTIHVTMDDPAGVASAFAKWTSLHRKDVAETIPHVFRDKDYELYPDRNLLVIKATNMFVKQQVMGRMRFERPPGFGIFGWFFYKVQSR